MENKSSTCHMTNEKRRNLIDRSTILNKAKKFAIYDGKTYEFDVIDVEDVKSAPTVDAVELPCRMGDIVWGIQKHIRGFQPKQGVVNQMYFGEDMQLCICVKNICRGEWGKKVFATKEEADAALAKMDGGNEDD